MNLEDLKKPFDPDDIEWRLSECGFKRDKKSIWAKCLAYITSRAAMDRFDEVCGPEHWQDEYKSGPDGGVVCGIGIRIEGAWVWKWDGAENTDIEPVKGGLAGAFKRAAVKWGIGRYLYDMPMNWANVHEDGSHFGRTAKPKTDKDPPSTSFNWDPPELPFWALPVTQVEKTESPRAATKPPATTKANGKGAKPGTSYEERVDASAANSKKAQPESAAPSSGDDGSNDTVSLYVKAKTAIANAMHLTTLKDAKTKLKVVREKGTFTEGECDALDASINKGIKAMLERLIDGTKTIDTLNASSDHVDAAVRDGSLTPAEGKEFGERVNAQARKISGRDKEPALDTSMGTDDDPGDEPWSLGE